MKDYVRSGLSHLDLKDCPNDLMTQPFGHKYRVTHISAEHESCLSLEGRTVRKLK